MLLERLEQASREAVKSAFGQEVEQVTLEFTDKFGDLALNAFHLARALRQAPPKIAEALAPILATSDDVAAAEAVSGYVNLTLRDEALFADAIGPVLEAPATFGSRPAGADAPKIMVEFASPNTNKPLHLGHVRNICLGDSIARLLEANGNEVLRANLVNDRGIHICKSMLAYEREGEGATPESTGKKGDHFAGDFYVLFETRFREEMAKFQEENPDRADISREDFFKISDWGRAAQEMLRLWEDGDEKTVALWKLMNGWVLDGFMETFETLGVAFDEIYFESETYQHGKELILEGLERGVFQKREDGAIEIDLSAEKLDRKVVVRSDGTSIYITQDIATTVQKTEKLGLSQQVFVVGNEQIYHFKVLFKILEKLGYDWASDLKHLAYGMVNLPSGKMKSREGTVVDADDLVDEVTGLAIDEIKARTESELDDEAKARARGIALAALKFFLLNVSPPTTMTYDPAASVSFDGDTGPYVLYAFARIRRMIEDSGLDENEVAFDAKELGDASERKLALKLLQFPGVVERAGRDWNPALVSSYLLQLARAYHSHNRAVPILKAEDADQRKARLALSRATATTLARGLELLGIQTVDRM